MSSSSFSRACTIVGDSLVGRNDSSRYTSTSCSPSSWLLPRQDRYCDYGGWSICIFNSLFGVSRVGRLKLKQNPWYLCSNSWLSNGEQNALLGWSSISKFPSHSGPWPVNVDRFGPWEVDDHRKATLRSLGLCRESVLWDRLPNSISAESSRIVTLATGGTSVTAEEEDVGNPVSTATEVSGVKKVKASGQLSRWARARKIRAGKLSPPLKKDKSSSSLAVLDVEEPGQMEREATPASYDDDDVEPGENDGLNPVGYDKSIYMVSDGTGWTADHSVHAALGQFEHCMVDRRCSVDTHLFSDVNDVDMLMGIIRHAGLQGGLVVYTLADPTMADAAKEACELLRVPHIDILGPITEAIGSHLGVSPLGLPRGAPGRKKTLSKQYFKRIEAVEFTIKQDDGALPKNLHLADIVLAGVSRTSKTPLSTYIAQKGYKVANVPLVFGIDPPKELFEIDQDKVFGLTINANFLKAIRLARYRHLGVAENSSSSYSDMEHIRRELDYSRKLFSQNPRWPVIEVTGKAIEETAAVILRLYHERRNKFSMPRISTRY